MRRRDATCYICGSPDALTSDHIFPKALFPPPRPAHLLTAPACGDCQQRLQPDEEYFRTFVASGAYRDDSARELWEGKIARSFENSPGLRKTFANAIRTMKWKSPGGIILGEVTGLEGDQERVGNVLKKMVRGLYFLDTGSVMPADVRFVLQQVSPLDREPVPEEVRDLLDPLPLREVGTQVLYKFAISPDDPRFVVGWLAFYRRIMFVVMTRSPDGLVAGQG